MKTFFNLIATTLIMIGIIMMAGSAGDCDGACMAQSNTLGEMLMIAGLGLAFFLTGGAILISNSKEDDYA